MWLIKEDREEEMSPSVAYPDVFFFLLIHHLVPGHKRAIPVPVPVLMRPPSTAPRPNRASELRASQQGGSLGPSSLPPSSSSHTTSSRQSSSSGISLISLNHQRSGQHTCSSRVEEDLEQQYQQPDEETEEEQAEECFGTVTILKEHSL